MDKADAGLAAIAGGAAVTGWVIWLENGLLILQVIATGVAIVAGILTIKHQLRKRKP